MLSAVYPFRNVTYIYVGEGRQAKPPRAASTNCDSMEVHRSTRDLFALEPCLSVSSAHGYLQPSS
jgi:hypothetical protein